MDPESAAASNPYRGPITSEEEDQAYDLSADDGIYVALRQTRPWVMFLGIMGFVGTGLMLLGGVGLLVGGIVAGARMGQGGPSMAVMGGIYALMALVYVPPSLYLIRYGRRIRDFLSAPSGAGLQRALTAQKSFWKFVGVLMAAVIATYVVFIVGALVFGVVGASLA